VLDRLTLHKVATQWGSWTLNAAVVTLVANSCPRDHVQSCYGTYTWLRHVHSFNARTGEQRTKNCRISFLQMKYITRHQYTAICSLQSWSWAIVEDQSFIHSLNIWDFRLED